MYAHRNPISLNAYNPPFLLAPAFRLDYLIHGHSSLRLLDHCRYSPELVIASLLFPTLRPANLIEEN
jgi:hypothetical protein